MPSSPLNRIRLSTLLFPPLGMWLLWHNREFKFGRKLLGTIGVLFYSVLYAAGMVLLLMQFTRLEVEWRGGFPPVLTFSKTKPDYRAVEAHRTMQTNQALRSLTAPPAVSDAYWTDFRGPNRDGHYTQRPILTNWPTGGLKKLWSQPIGGGYASFVVADGRAFTIEQRREQEAVTAYDVATGRELWAHSYAAAFSESMGGEGPRATPTYNDGRVYSLGAQGEFVCLEAATGRLLWRKNVLDEARATCLYFGMSTSPLIVDDKVIVLSGEPAAPMKGATNKTVLAYHKVTGERVWSAMDDKQAYTSPMLVTLAGQRELLIVAAKRIVGLKTEDGALLWEIPWQVQYDNAIAQPVIVDTNRFVISAGYGGGAMLVEISRAGESFTARQVWKNQNLKNKFNSSVFWNGFVYGLDEGILTCIEVSTGRRQWKEGRYGYGQLVFASGHLVVVSGEGELVLVQANAERHEELARFQAIQGKTWNHPAVADGKVLVRNAVEMACFEIEPPDASGSSPAK
jgi:outer membrane protein assembly factor BamB